MGLSWKAKKKGKIYCAPACGAGCTYAEYVRVNKLADALVKKCEKEVGGKWKKHVHENCGWHYSVNLVGGNINISEGGYKNRITDAKRFSIQGFSGGTPSQIHFRGYSKSIKWLVARQLMEVQKEVDRWNNYLKENKKALLQKN